MEKLLKKPCRRPTATKSSADKIDRKAIASQLKSYFGSTLEGNRRSFESGVDKAGGAVVVDAWNMLEADDEAEQREHKPRHFTKTRLHALVG